MRRARFSAVLFLLAASPAAGQPAPAVAQPVAPVTSAAAPLAPGLKVAAGRAPVVAGNIASSRERAIEDALRQAVEQAIGDLLEPEARAAHARELRSLVAKAHTYVRRYRVLEQGEVAGGYQAKVEADMDLSALRRDTERLRPSPPPATASGSQFSVLVVGTGPREAFAALIAALGTARVKAELGEPGLAADPARAAQAAASARHSLGFMVATAGTEGVVRGTGKASVACEVSLRLSTASAGGGSTLLAESTAAVRGFGDRAELARTECFNRAAAQLVGRMTPVMTAASGDGDVSGDVRAVTVEVDLIEPAVLGQFLRILRGLGGVSSAEIRRVAAGRADLRIATRLSGSALEAAVTREAVGGLVLTGVETMGDLVRLRIRAADRAESLPTVAPGAQPALKGGL